MGFNTSELIALAIVPMATGCISFIASLTIIIMILRSNLKLSTVYRRLFFFLSIFDLIQSASQVTSSIFMPSGTIWGAIGDQTTCRISGFMSYIGMTGSVLYSLSMSIYFLAAVKYNLSNKYIEKRIERFLHLTPILFSWTAGIWLYLTHNFNPSGTTCWVAPQPSNCTEAVDVINCITKGNPSFLQRFATSRLIIVIFLLNCAIAFAIWWEVHSRSRKMGQLYSRSATTSPQRSQRSNSGGGIQGEDLQEEDILAARANKNKKCRMSLYKCCPILQRHFENGSTSAEDTTSFSSPSALGPLATRLSRPSRATIQRLREISNRSLAFVVGFGLTYMFGFIHRFFRIFVDNKAPFPIIILARTFYPLQGLFNILIYTYPHVVSCQRNHEEYSWFRAFWEVVKSGGDSDQTLTRINRNGLRTLRRNGLRNEPFVTDVDDNLINDVRRVQATYQNSHSSVRNSSQVNSLDV